MTAIAMVHDTRVPAWRSTLVALGLLLVAILLAYRETAAAMVAIWERSGTFAHAFIVAPISLWLIWRQRAALAAVQPRPAPWVLMALATVALVWLLGELAAVNAVTQLALVGLLVLAVPAVAGWQATRTILFPLGFLFFAVPIGEFMMPRMMVWTADFTVLALRGTGIPVYREAQQIVIPSGTWSVVEACSGIRYLMASVMIGTLFAYLNYRTLSRRIAFVAVSILVPIVANWIRAYLIVLVGHLSDNRLAVGADHLIYGWVFFGLVVLAMFAIGTRWSEPPANASPARSGGPVQTRGWRTWLVAGAVAAVVTLPQLADRALALPESGSAVALSSIGTPRGGWQATSRPVAEWRPAFSGAAAELNTNYTRIDGKAVGVYIGYYRHQDAERKLVSSENVVVSSNDRQWLQTGSAGRSVDVERQRIAFRATQLRSRSPYGGSSDAFGVWQIYWIGGTLTSSDVVAKVLTALYRLAGRGDDGAVLMFYSPEPSAIEDFVRANLVAIDAMLERVRTRKGAETTLRKEVRG